MSSVIEEEFDRAVISCRDILTGVCQQYLNSLGSISVRDLVMTIVSLADEELFLQDLRITPPEKFKLGEVLTTIDLNLYALGRAAFHSESSSPAHLYHIATRLQVLATSFSRIDDNLRFVQDGLCRVSVNSSNHFHIEPDYSFCGGRERWSLSVSRSERDAYFHAYHSQKFDTDQVYEAQREIRRRVRVNWNHGTLTIKHRIPSLNPLLDQLSTTWKSKTLEAIGRIVAEEERGELPFSPVEWVEVLTQLFRMAKRRQQYLYLCHHHQQPFVDSWRENLWKLLILRDRAESLIRKLEKATGLKKDQIAEILRSISFPIGGSEVGELSRARIAQRPLLAIDGEFAFGCYWFEHFKSALCFEDLLSEKSKREAGAFFVKAMAKQFQSWGVDFVRTNVAYSFSQGAGDIDLLIVWGEFIFCCECKAFLGLPRHDRFRWKPKELRRAAAQAAKGVRFIEEHPRAFEQRASLPLELCRGRRVLPVIILHNAFMSGWKVDGVPVVNAAFVAMHRPHRGDEFEKLVNNPPDLVSLKLPTRVEPWHTVIAEFHFSGT